MVGSLESGHDPQGIFSQSYLDMKEFGQARARMAMHHLYTKMWASIIPSLKLLEWLSQIDVEHLGEQFANID